VELVEQVDPRCMCGRERRGGAQDGRD